MQISIITDEISADPETAVELGSAWGVRDFELRGYFTERAPCFSSYQKQRLRDILRDNEARIIAIGPGLFKIPYPSKHAPRVTLAWMDRVGYENWDEAHRLVRFHLDELLPASCDYANELGARLIVAFGFDRAGAPPGQPPDEVLNCLRLAAERVAAAGLQLVVETEAGFWADTGMRTAWMVQTINHLALGINWDPGNVFVAGEQPYPAGYQHVRGWVRHVHFKDARSEPSEVPHYALEGEIDWTGQIQALAADNYDGFVSVETHLKPKVAAAQAAVQRLRELVALAV